jgi:hypothetical protein
VTCQLNLIHTLLYPAPSPHLDSGPPFTHAFTHLRRYLRASLSTAGGIVAENMYVVL